MPDAPSLSTSLTPQEVALLEQALPRLADWSEKILVPFSVRQLRHCEVVWINERWFLQRGLDVTEESTRHRLSNWLCEEFGYAAPRQEDSFEAYTEQSKTFHADRYGSLNAREVHGGSGRAAIVGCFQAKGIGVTPLAGAGADWIHSHGCASLEEAIREAIYAEVLAAEFPYSAIPIIAILDTGLTFSRPSSEHPEEALMRRAIILRPSVVRPSHAERAPLFRKSLTGRLNSQKDDARRCRDVVGLWIQLVRSNDAPNIAELITRIVQQIVFGQVNRLFSGGYFSSNLTIDGALLDFGGTRALPNWINYRFVPHTPGFGEEMTYMMGLIQSLVFHFNKYRTAECPPLPPAPILLDHAKAVYDQAFQREAQKLWGLENETNAALIACITNSLRKYFLLQQRTRLNYYQSARLDKRWLYDVMIGDSAKEPRDSAEEATLEAVSRGLSDHFGDGSANREKRHHTWMTAVRLLMPRNEIDRDSMQKRIYREISPDGLGSKPNADVIRDLISSIVGNSRRFWADLSTNLTVIGHVSSGGCSALFCEQVATGAKVLWLQGVLCGDRLRLFTNWLVREDLESCNLKINDGCWSAQIIALDFHPLLNNVLNVISKEILIPKMQVVYPKIALRWVSPKPASHITGV